MQKNILILSFLLIFFKSSAGTENLQPVNQPFIDKGKKYMHILHGANGSIPKGKRYLKSIVVIKHYLYAEAKKKNQKTDFVGGTIFVEDSNGRLHSLLLEYVAREFKGNLYEEVWITNKKAYPRYSTHFNDYYIEEGKAKKGFLGTIEKTDKTVIHYGIDVKDKNLPLPIIGKHHILFGKINDDHLMFIKFEKYGLYRGDALLHGYRLIKSNINKKQSSIDESLVDSRRERIPTKFMEEFKALIRSKDGMIESHKQEEYLRKAKAFGIQEMIRICEERIQIDKGTQTWRDKLTNFVQTLKKQYPFDFFMRTGNEVILRHKDVIA